MSWIQTIGYGDANGKLKRLYDRIKGPNNSIDHVLQVHALRPHTLKGHMLLYKAVLHHPENELPKWYLEVLGTYTSRLNRCSYCVAHHEVGIRKNLPGEYDAEAIINAITTGEFAQALSPKFVAGIKYTEKLTHDPERISENDIDSLRKQGFTDGQILEINQVVSYFNYVNRMVLGLGVNLETENIGLSPKGVDVDDWTHQ